MHALRFEPIIKRARWGGRRLESVLGKPLGDGTDYAESWEIADHGDDQSVIIGGQDAGRSLHELITDHEAEVLGAAATARGRFPLLIKLLDASDRLSLQVHPNDEQARAIDPEENGKTEAWIILEAEPGSQLFCGLQSGVDDQALREALSGDTLSDVLHSFTVQPGDAVFIPAGTVHAIGEGILLAEIQQQSDITWRLHDWGRMGSDGQPRELHLEESLACIDFDRGPVRPVTPGIVSDSGPCTEQLVRCSHFAIDRHTSTEPFDVHPEGRFRILMVIDGSATLHSGSVVESLTRGATVLIPASADPVQIAPGNGVTVLETWVPGNEHG